MSARNATASSRADTTMSGVPSRTASKELAPWERYMRDWPGIARSAGGLLAGLPLTVLRSFAAPPQALLAQAEAYRERVASSVSGLLALLGMEVDPISSREHILLANVLDQSWRAGHDLDMAGLIQCYVMALPFLKYTVAGDLFWCAALFGGAWLVQRMSARTSDLVAQR